MDKNDIYLTISNKQFKDSSKEIRKAIKETSLVPNLKRSNDRLNQIAIETSQRRLNSNLEILSQTHLNHIQYVSDLKKCADSSTSYIKQRNFLRRIRYANKIHEELTINLYRLNIEIYFFLKKIDKNKKSSRVIMPLEEEFEQ